MSIAPSELFAQGCAEPLQKSWDQCQRFLRMSSEASHLDRCMPSAYDFFAGTFLPSFRALERPMAIACFLLVTFLSLSLLRNLPSFLAFISVSTFLLADFEYFRFDDF